LSPRLVWDVGIDVNIDFVDSALSPAVLGVTVPLALSDDRLSDVGEKETAPLAARR
jgi:hypothetical protein